MIDMTAPARPTATRGRALSAAGLPAEGEAFPLALRSAIATRGASLESLRQGLLERGTSVSVATLSYWRSGRSRPDRGASMVALGQLEQLLSVPAGFLSAKVAPRGPASAIAGQLPSHYVPAPPLDPDMAQRSDIAAEALGQLGLATDDGMRWVSLQDTLTVNDDLANSLHDVRTLVVAERDAVDRYGVWYAHADPSAFPFVVGLSNCHLGRAVEIRELGAVAAEIMLDHPLNAEESLITEHRLESVGRVMPLKAMLRRVTRPVRDLTMELRLPEGRVPRQIRRHTVTPDGPQVEEIRADSDRLHLWVGDPLRGSYGFDWTW